MKKGASHVVNKVSDAFDRRALENIQQGAGGKHHAVILEGGTPEKVRSILLYMVHTVRGT